MRSLLRGKIPSKLQIFTEIYGEHSPFRQGLDSTSGGESILDWSNYPISARVFVPNLISYLQLIINNNNNIKAVNVSAPDIYSNVGVVHLLLLLLDTLSLRSV